MSSAILQRSLPNPSAKVVPRGKIATYLDAVNYALAGFHAVQRLDKLYGSSPSFDQAAGIYWDTVVKYQSREIDLAGMLALLVSADSLVATEIARHTQDGNKAVAIFDTVIDTIPKIATKEPVSLRTKVAIGIGAGVVVTGLGFAAYKLLSR